ncbi:hypothetical protein D3C84_1289460 [compost metagenome]
MEARVGGAERLADAAGVVTGGVIRHQRLEIDMSLGGQRLQRLENIRALVVDRQADHNPALKLLHANLALEIL